MNRRNKLTRHSDQVLGLGARLSQCSGQVLGLGARPKHQARTPLGLSTLHERRLVRNLCTHGAQYNA